MAAPAKLDTGVGKMAPAPKIIAEADKTLGESMLRLLNDWLSALVRKLNNISLGDGTNYAQAGNLDAVFVQFVFAAADTAYQIPHSLGRTPVGVVTVAINKGAGVFTASTTAWATPQDIYLECTSADCTALLLVF